MHAYQILQWCWDKETLGILAIVWLAKEDVFKFESQVNEWFELTIKAEFFKEDCNKHFWPTNVLMQE